VRRAILAFVLWLLACGAAVVLGARPHPGLLALVVLAAGAAVFLFVDVAESTVPTVWVLHDDDPVRPPGEDPRMELLARVVNAHLVSQKVGGAFHAHLMDIADQRLVAHHGVSRLADPDRAAALMGPELASFAAATDPYPRLSTDQIDVLIDRIEQL
jgi:hypothetical protein